jgi:hypothetical protein
MTCSSETARYLQTIRRYNREIRRLHEKNNWGDKKFKNLEREQALAEDEEQ